MKIYTRGGDRGTTALFGGSRVEKDCLRVECYGTLDEANASLGMIRAKLDSGHSWQQGLFRIQTDLMNIMSHLATPPGCTKPNPKPKPVDGPAFCESWMDTLEAQFSNKSDYFVLPGGTEISALCHVARTQFRRAERRIVTLMRTEDVDDYILAYVNRLSDLLFVLARAEMEAAQIPEDRWELFRKKK